MYLCYEFQSQVHLIFMYNYLTFNLLPSASEIMSFWKIFCCSSYNFKRLSLIVRVNVILNRTVVVDSD